MFSSCRMDSKKMNNKTYETIQQTIRRFETILEVDTDLDAMKIYWIKNILTSLNTLLEDENNKNTPI